jgi:hypothetical protein
MNTIRETSSYAKLRCVQGISTFLLIGLGPVTSLLATYSPTESIRRR